MVVAPLYEDYPGTKLLEVSLSLPPAMRECIVHLLKGCCSGAEAL